MPDSVIRVESVSPETDVDAETITCEVSNYHRDDIIWTYTDVNGDNNQTITSMGSYINDEIQTLQVSSINVSHPLWCKTISTLKASGPIHNGAYTCSVVTDSTLVTGDICYEGMSYLVYIYL